MFVQVLPIGKFYHNVYGEVNITQQMLEQMVANFKKGIPHYDLPVNIEHLDHLGAVGNIKDLILKDDGLYAELELTEEGQKLIEEKKFNYTSAEFVENYTDKKTGEQVGYTLVGLALTNKPANPYVKKIHFKDFFKQFFKTFRDLFRDDIQFVEDEETQLTETYKGFVLEPNKEWNWSWSDDANKIIEEKGWQGLANVCLYVDKENYELDDDGLPHNKDAYYFPIAKLGSDGKYHAYFSAVSTALSYLNGARGGVKLSDEVKKKIYNKIVEWYKAFGKEEVPELKLSERSEYMEELEKLKQDYDRLLKENEELKSQLANLQQEFHKKQLSEIENNWKHLGLRAEAIEKGLKLLKEDLSNLAEVEELLKAVATPELFEKKYRETAEQNVRLKTIEEFKKFF